MTFFSKKMLGMFVVGLLLGGGITYFVFSGSKGSVTGVFTELRQTDSSYHLINPLLACGNDLFSQFSNKASVSLEQKVSDLVAQQKSSGSASEAAIYFRELNGGPWFGIDQDTLFTPGSLLKVPLIMSIYKAAEDNPSLLNQSIMYEGGSAPATEHYTAAQIQIGKVYSVEDLVRATLVYSDNNAALLLAKLITKEDLDASYADLGIQVPESGQDYTMTVRTYASFFRILFNSTYLTRAHSDHVLELLSEAVFRDGLVAGTPSGVTVAHKFGERSYDGGSSVQLHDCGIVYKTSNPYLLCVMMRGSNDSYSTLANNIRDIAKLVYQYAE